jgi:hypothetical protein
MEVRTIQAQSSSRGILAFLQCAGNKDKPPLQIGDLAATNAVGGIRGAIRGPASDLRGLGIGRNLDVTA